ncbi:uncharacterized protein LOC108116178 [Drosophila eugracilis]|uniref:uncharacterized protein LOC108116178 n=1 Tax=Drosophila eugracilis TaxID=29029 RepID=UPI0007E783CA|nr:uncharacterized protein LOC108116178 [Drosophila eugracilis]
MKNRNLRCVVTNCFESGEQDSRSMYKFPINPVIRQKWMENIGLVKDINWFNTRVCRRHFETQCFGKTKVYSWAVPTLFLGEKRVLHHGFKSKKNNFVRKCCVRNCPSRSPPDRLHFFPSDPNLRREWMDICHLEMDLKWLFICGRHFRRHYLPNSNGNLKKDAIPELNLGTEGEDPLGKCIKSKKSSPKRSKLCTKSDDSGIDEGSSKKSSPPDPCSNCLDLKQQLASALLQIQQLEETQQAKSDSDEEEEYIFMLMK